jgi:hypothetical protein
LGSDWNGRAMECRHGDCGDVRVEFADPCVIVGAQGVGEIGRAELADMLEGAPYQLKSFAIEDVHLRRLSDEVAALAYKAKEELVVEGEKVSLEAFDSSIWQRRNGRWVCVVHTESLAGDPFGRN